MNIFRNPFKRSSPTLLAAIKKFEARLEQANPPTNAAAWRLSLEIARPADVLPSVFIKSTKEAIDNYFRQGRKLGRERTESVSLANGSTETSNDIKKIGLTESGLFYPESSLAEIMRLTEQGREETLTEPTFGSGGGFAGGGGGATWGDGRTGPSTEESSAYEATDYGDSGGGDSGDSGGDGGD